MGCKKRFFLSILLITIVINCLFLVNATFLVGNASDNINSQYVTGEKISGWINVSFINEPIGGIISNGVNSIKLIDLIKNSSAIYTCNPLNCLDKYSKQGSGAESKVIAINGDKLVGIELNGKEVEVTKFSINISSNAVSSCDGQLDIDVLDDNSINWGNNKFMVESCESDIRSKCYSGEYSQWLALSSQTYCENITLPKAPAFEIKAFIKKDIGATEFSAGIIKAEIFEISNEERYIAGGCSLSDPTNSGNYASCLINYTSKEKGDYLICISTREPSESGSVEGYSIRGKSSGPFCGFLGDPTIENSFEGDYDVSVETKKFGPVGGIVLNETVFASQNNQESLIEYINNYIGNKYNKNCTNGCIIPFGISGLEQQITINNVNVVYTSTGSAGTTVSQIYELAKTPALISNNFSKLNLDSANFKAPNEKGNKTLIISLNGNEILRKKINVIGQSDILLTDIYPKETAAAYQTTFTAIYINGSTNISSSTFQWQFGDGTPVQTSSTNKIQHTYTEVGNYTIKVKAIKNNIDLGSVSLNILVKSPKDLINSTIKSYRINIAKIKSQISSFPNEYQETIKEKLDINELTSELDEIESDYKSLISKSSTTDNEYIEIMNLLNAMKIPKAIQASVDKKTTFIDDKEIIDTKIINDLFDEDYSESENVAYQNAISKWSNIFIDATLENKVISIYYEDSIENIISEFVMQIQSKKTIDYPVYLVISEDKDNLIYLSENKSEETEGATGVVLDLSNSNTVKFAVEGSVDSFEIPIYLAPKSDKISITGEISEIPEESFWKRALIPFIILVIVFFVIYILLQEWYKKNYESHLFKNKNDLYNLIYFVSNAKNQRLLDNEIKIRLKKSNWKSEQIDYAIKKFEGKRVGMWEIPIFKWRDKKKINEEMMKRNARKMIY